MPASGKTRLVRELWEWLAGQRRPQPLRRTGRCLSYGQGITYWPLAEVLKEHFGILEGDSADAVAHALASHPFLGLTLGLSPEAGPPPARRARAAPRLMGRVPRRARARSGRPCC